MLQSTSLKFDSSRDLFFLWKLKVFEYLSGNFWRLRSRRKIRFSEFSKFFVNLLIVQVILLNEFLSFFAILNSFFINVITGFDNF